MDKNIKYIEENLGGSGWLSKENSLKHKNSGLYEDILLFCDEYSLECSFKEKIWYYYNGVKENKKCKLCSKSPIFYNLKKGYGIYCSKECRKRDESDIWKKVKEKTKERFGVENPSNSKELIEKRNSTNILKYGGTSPAHSEVILNKMKDKNMERIGVEYPSQNNKVKEKYYSTIKTKKFNQIPNLIDISYETKIITMLCDNGLDHKFNISFENFQNRKRYGINICTICNKKNISQKE